MKELISVRECVELFDVPATHHNKLRACLELANKRHEEAMKQRAIEFAEQWLIKNVVDYDDISTEEAYNENYGKR